MFGVKNLLGGDYKNKNPWSYILGVDRNPSFRCGIIS